MSFAHLTSPRPTQGSVTNMTKAFELAGPASGRDSEPRAVTYALVDEEHEDPIDAGIAQMRRDHLAKYVKVTMAGSVLICLMALVRVAVSGGGPEEEVARATFAKMREVPAEIAALPRSVSKLTNRTEAALKIEKRRELSRAKATASRAKAFW
jgi:hypothetical protein